MRFGIASVLSVLLLILVNGSMFIVPQGTHAIITQFGEVKGDPIDKAGLHFKMPFVHDVRSFDKRILSWDGDAEQIPTRDKKYIWVDTTARWRIKDVRKFAETVHSERGARDRLDGILDGVTRDTISSHNLVDAVRNSNRIFEQIANKKAEAARLAAQPTEGGADNATAAALEEEVTGEVERIATGREQLAKLIIERARRELEPFGIELIDVQLRRIAYEKGVEDKVYDRMISERNRIAEKIRSIGKGEEARIRGTLNRDLKQIESEAYRVGQEVKGKADAQAINIFAASLKQDPEFYEFTRTMAAYRKSFTEKGRLVLSTDSEFLKYMRKGP